MATNVVSETFEGTPSGSNLALPQHELDDTEARMIMDGLVDYPGKERRRGPVAAVLGSPTFSRMGSGLVMALNPKGQARFAVLTGDAANGYLSVLDDNAANVAADLAWPFPLPADPDNGHPYFIVDAKPALSGGTIIGVSSDYNGNNPSQGVALWYGGNKPNYSPANISVARGSSSVTGVGTNFTANVVPGMFLFANTDEGYTSALVGVVLNVVDATHLTLLKASPYAISAKAGTLQSIRGLAPKVTTGRITTDTASTTVSGGSTKFISQGLGTGTWQLYRLSDNAFIGKVSSIQSETSLTLTANAAVAAADEEYVAIQADADFNIVNTASTKKTGFLNATYADRQWYLHNGASFDKTSRLEFSDTNDPEALDLSEFDGNWFDVTSSSTVNEPGRAIAPAYNGLVVFKENETFVVTGSSPTDFTVRKLEDDGALSGMSVQQYGGGVIWAGREGIHFYDGIQTENLTQTKLGDYYKNTIRTFDPTKYRMWSMINRDHYWLFIESVQPTVPIVKGQVSTTPDKYAIVINLATRAVTFAENVDVRGAITLPASSGKHVWYLVNGRDSSDYGTFGKTTVGTTYDYGFSSDYHYVDTYAAVAGSTMSKLTAYVSGLGAGSGSQKMRWAVYADSAGSPGALIGVTNEVTINAGQPWDWVDFTFATPPTVAASPVWIGPWFGGPTANVIQVSTDGNPGAKYKNSVPYSSTNPPPSPFGVPDGSTGAHNNFAVYATYSMPDHAFICDGESLYLLQGGVDPITCAGSSGPGPDFYWESKKFDAGDSVRLKQYKWFIQQGLVQGDAMKIDIVLGLNDTGESLTKTFTPTVYTWATLHTIVPTWTALKTEFPTWASVVNSVFLPQRFKFSKRSTHISFRVYQASSAVTRLELGPFKIGYKLLRDGRI